MILSKNVDSINDLHIYVIDFGLGDNIFRIPN